jgi:glycosyltransferase involved in cell wall biosynthesis
MYKINVVSYVDAFKKPPKGGGEMINEAIIRELGMRKDVDLKYFAVYSNRFHRFLGSAYSSSILHDNPDLNILIDINNIPKFKNRINQKLLNKLTSQKYVHIDNSYVDVCSQDYLPCDGNSDKCQCNLSQKVTLYKNSEMNFFLSPLHRDIIVGLLNHKINSSILPPFLDLDNIPTDNELSKDIEYLYVGTISNYKGYNEIEKLFSHVGDKFFFIGPKDKSVKLFTKNHIQWATRKEVYSFMLRSKKFVHLPLWKEPMGRTILEASLCGCEIIGNQNVGALSFDFDLGNRKNYENALSHAVDLLLRYAV